MAGGPSWNVMQTKWKKFCLRNADSYFYIWFVLYVSLPNWIKLLLFNIFFIGIWLPIGNHPPHLSIYTRHVWWMMYKYESGSLNFIKAIWSPVTLPLPLHTSHHISPKVNWKILLFKNYISILYIPFELSVDNVSWTKHLFWQNENIFLSLNFMMLIKVDKGNYLSK